MLRVLLLADTHLGFDLPARPRVERRRRGADFFVNTRLALEPALAGEADVVVHGGDLLYRSKVPAGLVSAALEPLLEVADAGIPVVLVPGNHERSALPYPMLASHQNLHLLDRPRTVRVEVNGLRLAVSGFPCERNGIRDQFAGLVEQTDGSRTEADIRLLCLHQSFEGARVKGYTFRAGADIVRGRDIPEGFAAVLSGHIHRSQVLNHDLGGRRLASPVLYPGSIERTSQAERDEAKGYMMLEFEPGTTAGGRLSRWDFHELPARPMFLVVVEASGVSAPELDDTIRAELAALPNDAVVQIRVDGAFEPEAEEVVRASNLRRMHSPEMTVELRCRRGSNRSAVRGS